MREAKSDAWECQMEKKAPEMNSLVMTQLKVTAVAAAYLQLHQSFDVIDPRCFPIAARGAESLLQQVLLLPLDGHHPLLH